MLNAKRNFFIIVSNVYEAFDFSAPGFIQLLIRKAHLPRACFVGTRKDLTSNDTNKRGWGTAAAATMFESLSRRFASVAAAAPKRSSISPRSTRRSLRYFELGNQEPRKWDFRDRRQRRDG